MYYERPFVMTLAGFDPSGGAGVLADIKTLEAHRCIGLGALTANTIQTEDAFYDLSWYSTGQIKAQVTPLISAYPVRIVKIGIVESLTALNELVSWLLGMRPGVKIIWDPVIAASAGYTFLNQVDKARLARVLRGVFLVTPNIQEARILAGLDDEHEAAVWLSARTQVLLKGGHSDQPGTDYLYANGQRMVLEGGSDRCYAKHGSGCILSSAVAAGLAYGHTLEAACVGAKKYIGLVLGSNQNLLAYHHV